jgi:thiol:disulfide interchange protein
MVLKASCDDELVSSMNFHMSQVDEYKVLREEIAMRQKEIYKIELWALIAIAAFFAWCLLHDKEAAHLPRIVFIIPSVIAFLCSLRCLDHTLHINWIGEYIQKLEQSAFKNESDPRGWEHFYRQVRRRRLVIIFNVIAGLFWLVLIVGSLLASLWMP